MAAVPIPAPSERFVLEGGLINPRWYQFLASGGKNPTSITEAQLNLSDVTTDNVTNLRHGFAPKITGSDGYQLTSSGTSATWKAPKAGDWANILDFGGDPTFTNDNTAAFYAAWTSGLLRQKAVYFPPGQYKFTQSISITLPDGGYFGGAIIGAGQEATRLTFTNGGNSLSVLYQGSFYSHSMQFRDFSITTTVAGTGVGLYLRTNGLYQNFPTATNIVGVSIYPEDKGYAGSAYFNYCLRSEGVSIINFTNCLFQGRWGSPSATASAGTGVSLQGAGNAVYGIVYNFQSCYFVNLLYGLEYGAWIQGVTFNQCNFNGRSGIAGIHGQPYNVQYNPNTGSNEGSIQAQLCVTNSQFDIGMYGIFMEQTCYNTTIQSCPITSARDNGVVIYLAGSYLTSIIGCGIQTYNNPSNVTGIKIGPAGRATIVGNTFKDLALGYTWDPGTDKCQGGLNSFDNVSLPFNNSGSSIAPGTGGSPAHP